MNKMRYAKSDAKDYTQHSHPIKAWSVVLFANAQTVYLLLPTELRKLNISGLSWDRHPCFRSLEALSNSARARVFNSQQL